MNTPRYFTFLDRLCLNVDQVVRTLSNNPKTTGKPNPAGKTKEATLTDQQRSEIAALMRINHAGEICAQALYHGQSVASRSNQVSEAFKQAAQEEGDHLAWCHQRLVELGSHTSYLSPIWYGGSFCIGMLAGMAGDRWSLGFVAETERQVIAHLESHLRQLPEQDQRSRHILKQMEQDEAKHRDEAVAGGAKYLPKPIQRLMALTSKIMVKTTYWI